MALIEVINGNGQKQMIPAHWLDHPTLGKGFRRSRRRQAQAPRPSAPQSPPAPREDVTRPGDSNVGNAPANIDPAPSADQEG